MALNPLTVAASYPLTVTSSERISTWETYAWLPIAGPLLPLFRRRESLSLRRPSGDMIVADPTHLPIASRKVFPTVKRTRGRDYCVERYRSKDRRHKFDKPVTRKCVMCKDICEGWSSGCPVWKVELSQVKAAYGVRQPHHFVPQKKTPLSNAPPLTFFFCDNNTNPATTVAEAWFAPTY